MNVNDVLAKMPAPGDWRRVRYRDGTNENIISVIHKNLSEAIRITAKAAPLFRGDTDTETCENVWNFIKQNIRYKADGVKSQDVRLPNRLLRDGVGDCKSFSLFTAAILANLGVPDSFRYVSFKRDHIPSHVYCVAKDESGGEIPIDAVWKKFNSEHWYTFKRDEPVKMEVAVMGGFAEDTSRDQLIQKRKLLRDRLRELPVESALRVPILSHIRRINEALDSLGVGSVWDTVKKISLAPGRKAFEGLVALNVHKLASSLAAAILKDKNKVKIGWEKLGGNFNSLVNAVNSGAKKKPVLGFNGIGVLPAVAAALAAAAPVIVAIGNLLKSIKPETSGTVDDIFSAVDAAGGVLTPIPADAVIVDDESKGFFASVPLWAWGVGALGVGYFIFSD